MMFAAGAPKEYLAEPITTAVYLGNLTPTRSMKEGSPFEAWYGKRPNLAHLRVWACVTYECVPKETRRKLDANVCNCVFLGYTATTKQYKLYDHVNKKVALSRDVKFEERRSYFCLHYPGAAPSGRVFYYVPSYSPVKVELTGGSGNTGLGPGPGAGGGPLREAATLRATGDVAVPLRTPERAVGKMAEPAETMELPGSFVNAPGEQLGREQAERDTQKKKRSFLRELALSEGSARWKTPGGSCTRRGAAGMVMDYEMMVEKGPSTCRATLDSNEGAKWAAAIRSEEASIVRNGTFEVVSELPPGIKAIPTKVILTKKLDPTGKQIRFKARLVAQGFQQVPGVDYLETLSPVATLESLRLVLTIAAVREYEKEQLDVVTAFLGGKAEEEIYISLPEGILGGPRLARLIKVLYGLKQSPRCWNITINEFIVAGLGFVRSHFDPCVYIRPDGTVIVIYVYDLLIISCYVAMQTIKHRLAQRFDVVVLGEVKHFLGMVISRDREHCTISLGQGGYVERLLGRFGLADCHGVSTPLESKMKVLPFDVAVDQPFNTMEYRRAIGALHWLADATRPDIAFATGFLGCFLATPGQRHWLCVKRVLRYLAKTRGLSLQLGGEMSTEELIESFTGYVDADFAGDTMQCRSTTGFIFKIGVGAMVWHSWKQSIKAVSTVDAEFIASAMAIGALIWFR